ncbi:uncharacterized protein LOC135152137 [Daucus carota subsp. sativus]|uniref:uncharacterized protein LOC135152137 n=1 Tax=Daucus carota subsp. sativus TaxID=79200 RepID=UPI003082CB94
MGPLGSRNVETNDKVECFYPRFLMLLLNDKMTEADKNFYFNAERLNVKQTSLKLINKLAKGTKYNEVPLIVTPFMSERFNAQRVPYQVQVAQPQQHQQQQQQDQQLQLQLQQPPQPQAQQQQSPDHTPEQLPVQSPIPQQQYPPFEDESLPFDFFEAQPSSSAPIQPTTQPQYSPPIQSTSQPLPSDSAIDPDLQEFRDDLQVAQVLSDFSSNFNVDISDYGCNFDLFCKPASNEPDNTQELLGNVQVDLPSLASGGQFVPPLPLNPFQGTLVVYTGISGAMSESSDERQTPSDTHAREASETALSKGAQLVTLEKKVEEEPSSSYRDELKSDIHCLTVEMRSNHELYMSKFDEIDSKLDQLLRNSKSDAPTSGEDPSTKGGNRVKGGEDKVKSSNQSNKGNTNTNTSDSAPGRESEKSKI